jgi:hypothetical protein
MLKTNLRLTDLYLSQNWRSNRFICGCVAAAGKKPLCLRCRMAALFFKTKKEQTKVYSFIRRASTNFNLLC